jgi:opacity protein-like surface antigen
MNKFIASLFGVVVSASAFASDLYVSGSVGTTTSGTGQAIVGLAVGSDIHQNLRVEGQYQYDPDREQHNVFGHLMPQVRIPNTGLSPYALVGLGADLGNLGNNPLYVVGGGLRVDVSKLVDLDFRYRRIDSIDNNDRRDIVSTGVNFKF